jgi:hypothetical protein
MKKSLLWFGLWLMSVGCLSAQVTMKLSLDQEQFLPGEALFVSVRINNQSGQTLNLGGDDEWLKFSVESRDVPIVTKRGEAPVAENIILESAHAAIKRVNIAPYFNFKKPGRYSVTATAVIKDWGQEITAAPVSFDIINAAMLREIDFGVPLPAGVSNRPPEVRKYTLLQANYLKDLMLYFRLSDASGTHDKVFSLGRMLNMNLQDTQIDRASNLHLLYQIGAHSSCYTMINPDGELLKRQTYEFSAHPHLSFDESGAVTVVGAMRVAKPNDLPKAGAGEMNISEPK